MRNTNDIIVLAVSGVLAIAFGTVFYFTKPEPEQPPQPPSVNVAEVKPPEAKIVRANGIPGGGGTGAGAAATPAPGTLPPGLDPALFGPGAMGAPRPAPPQ